ncbi:hypothetical protein BTHERMOSOX_306 [Bathymodiolus thermophilus thioautotrophic gill symbiont]|nr:hypothetical protein BTHERMOSOX_306 [Bathymodiolus thermophilus thioautotrophic gill symbiont]
MPAVSITRAVKVFVPVTKVTASSAVAHAVLVLVSVLVVATQFVPSALTCSVSSFAKVSAFSRVKLTLTALSLVMRSLSNMPASLLMVTVCVPASVPIIVLSMVTLEVCPKPLMALPNKVPDKVTCTIYALSPSNAEVQLASLTNVQLPSVSMLIAFFKASLTICCAPPLPEINLISAIDTSLALL